MIRLAEPGGAGRLPAAARRRLAAGMERALQAAGEGAAEVSILLCDDAEIRTLNRSFADEDHATDVLSFSQREGWGAPDAALLGDIVVSVETAGSPRSQRSFWKRETASSQDWSSERTWERKMPSVIQGV